MITSRASLKAKAANLAKKTNIPNKYIIQNFMFEALLKRIVLSKYKDNFILKGGLLLSSIFGVDLRSTMDMDTTIKGINLDKETITKVINEIISIDIKDNITLKIENIKDLLIDDKNIGFNINIRAEFDGLWTNLMIDITSGDIITYSEIKYEYKTQLENEIIEIMSYNCETILAEKMSAIISRNIDSTRMKDYYDVYMFVNEKWSNINVDTLKKAIENTFKNKETYNYLLDAKEYIKLIEEDNHMADLWNSYRNNYYYAKDITFEDTIKAIKSIIELFEENQDVAN